MYLSLHIVFCICICTVVIDIIMIMAIQQKTHVPLQDKLKAGQNDIVFNSSII